MKCPKCHSENPETATFCADCGAKLLIPKNIEPTKTAETPKEELTTGSTFAGRYHIIEELGKGGMGKVYRVIDKELNEEVALKLIKPEIAKDKKTIERFKNELKVARKISHRHIGRMYELMEENDTYFITMEYVPGQDLRALIRQTGQLTTGKAIAIAKDISEGLTEAHRQGITHRDLKPSNIIIDRAGSARILDFGIARSAKGKKITAAGMMIGTPEYMSPEQVEGKEVDQRSDIYSLGIILYEMVTGKVPFEGDTPFTVGVKHKSEAPKDPKEINTQIHQNLSRIILRCLEKDKEKRYQSAADVLSELVNTEKGIPSEERVAPAKKPITSREITVSFSLKKIFIPAFVIAAALIGLLFWSPWSKTKHAPISTDKPSIAVLYFRNGTGDQSMDHWREDLCDSVITDLSQSKYIRILSFDRIFSILKKNNLLDARNYSTEDLMTVAAEGKADHILWGSLSRAEDLFRIKYTLQDIKNGNIIGSDSLEGRGVESIFSMVDQLTIKIKQDLKLTNQQISDDRDMGVKTITTSSSEAYRYYREGRDLFLRDDYRESIPLLERAVEIDPNFALAYRGLSTSYSLIDINKYKDYAAKAYELRTHASHEERLVIEAYYFGVVEEDTEKSIQACEKILEEYPNNNFARGQLTYLYDSLEDWDKVIVHMTKAIAGGDEWMSGYNHLGTAYEAKGMYEKARQVYQDYIDNIQDHAGMHARIADSYVYEGKYEQAILEADKAIGLDPNSYTKAPIYHLQGDFEAAKREYKSLLDKNNMSWKMNGRRSLAILYRMLGLYGKAEKEALAGLKLAEEIKDREWQRTFYFILAWEDLSTGKLKDSYARAEKILTSAAEDELPLWQVFAIIIKLNVKLEQNKIEESLFLAEEVKKNVDRTPSIKDVCWYLFCRGQIEEKKKNYEEAIDFFSRSYSLLGHQKDWFQNHGWILFRIASAYYLKGDLESAEKEYENILALTTGRFFWGDLYVKSFYRLGKIYEQRSNKTKAVEYFEKFLDLRKNADNGQPEVEDARKILAGLKPEM
ncbi:MAG: protein kinase [Candidatus Aminicenantes bacterium]|nr:protein kinase [Candidatus Aminicenantes bacterium]